MMPLGLILLVVIGILLLFGVLHNVMDRMRMNDKWAFAVVLGMLVGSWIPDIPLGAYLTVNIGGALIPLGVCVYLWIKAGTAWERIRALIAAVAAAGVMLLIDRYFPAEPVQMPFDVHYLYGIAAGLCAYVLGRSRRAALIAGILGVLLGDVFTLIWAWRRRIGSVLRMGGAGAMDAMVLSAVIAVLLCELIGETWEKLQGGTKKKHMTFENGEFVEAGGKR